MVWEFMMQSRNWGLHKWLAAPAAHDPVLARQLWEQSAAACGLTETI